MDGHEDRETRRRGDCQNEHQHQHQTKRDQGEGGEIKSETHILYGKPALERNSLLIFLGVVISQVDTYNILLTCYRGGGDFGG